MALTALNYEGSRTTTRRTTDSADRKYTQPGTYVNRTTSTSTPKTSSTPTVRAPSAAPAPTAPTVSPAPQAPQDPHAHEGPKFNVDALEKILAGIEAQYGLSREQLLAGEGQAADLYRFIVANLSAAKQQALAQVEEGSIRRGILRSGIAQEQQARVENQFAQQQAQAASQRDQQLSQVALALQQLDADLNREKTRAAVDYAQDEIGTAEALAKALELV